MFRVAWVDPTCAEGRRHNCTLGPHSGIRRDTHMRPLKAFVSEIEIREMWIQSGNRAFNIRLTFGLLEDDS